MISELKIDHREFIIKLVSKIYFKPKEVVNV